ncbi:hypothetical protein ZWY2020_014740 [Hordeum vulgare]|nr:hypothetical protein ZWY2020_014740 [Hordeum vulgare]
MSNDTVAMNRPNTTKEEVANKRYAPMRPQPQPHRPATTNAAGKKIYYLDMGEAPMRRPVPRTMRILTSSTVKVSDVASGGVPEKSSAPLPPCRSALIPAISNGAAAVKPANAAKEAVGKKRSAPPPPSPPRQSALVPLATINAAGKKIAYTELGEAKRRSFAPSRNQLRPPPAAIVEPNVPPPTCAAHAPCLAVSANNTPRPLYFVLLPIPIPFPDDLGHVVAAVEPWDPSAHSVINSDDPEWFFAAASAQSTPGSRCSFPAAAHSGTRVGKVPSQGAATGVQGACGSFPVAGGIATKPELVESPLLVTELLPRAPATVSVAPANLLW